MDGSDVSWKCEETPDIQIDFRDNDELEVLKIEEKQDVILDSVENTKLDLAVQKNNQRKLFTNDEKQDISIGSEVISHLKLGVQENYGPTEFGISKNVQDINSILDCERNTALHIAIRTRTEENVLELLQKGANTNQKNTHGNTSVHEAVIQGKQAILKVLVENGGDINLTGQDGLLPLQLAATSKDANCLDAVLACHPDMNKKDDHGNTTLIHYVNEHYSRIIDILKLLEYGSDPNITNKLGWNCLHIIATEWQQSKSALVRTLIQYGININAELPGIKITPLHLAYSSIKNEYLVHILLQNDAIFTKNWKKMKPFDVVSWGNLSKICAHGVLREHRCKELRRITHLSEVSEMLFTRIFKRCKKELEDIKQTKIEGFTLSYYDFLFCSREESSKLSIKKQFRVGIAQSIKYFSIYSDFLMDKLYQGIQLRRANIDACFFISAIFKIPYVCSEEILSYFSTDELLFLQRRLEISGYN